MKDTAGWIKWGLPIGIGLLINIIVWFGGYMVLKSDVNNIKSELDKTNIAVIANELQNMKEQNNRLEHKVDELTTILLQH